MERRRFSAALQGQNLRFTGAGEGGSARARVGFLLLEHFLREGEKYLGGGARKIEI